MMKRRPIFKKSSTVTCLSLVFALLLSSLAYAQERKVTGKITSVSSSEGIPGASVYIKGTTSGTISDVDGNYSISINSDDDILVFSFIGMQSVEMPVGSVSVLDVAMEDDVLDLAEVIVVGYGTQKKSTLTTAVSTIDGDEIGEIPVADLGQALQGRAAGVNITNGGSPGGKTLIRIRGMSTFGDGDPLVVIDGVFMTPDDLRNINPGSVSKVDVLKDAAATAIYGSRGSNGVIIVTTNKGSRNGKASFKIKTYAGIQQSNQRYDVMNTDQYIQFLREIAVQEYDGRVAEVVQDPNFNGNGINTNWQDELFQSGSMKGIDFTASNGNDKGRYSFGFSAFDQEGIYIDTRFKRYTFNINSEANIFKNLRVGQNLSVGHSQRVAPVVWGGREPLYNAIALPPYIPVKTADGVFGSSLDSQDGNDAINIVRVADTQDNLNRFNTIYGNLYGELDIIEGLTFKTQYGIYANSSNQDDISRAFQTTGRAKQDETIINKQRDSFISQQLTNSLTIDQSFNKHNVRLTLVHETQETNFESLKANVNTTLTSELEEISNGSSGSSSTPDKLVSYLGRFNYDFDEKYLLQLSIRRDKSAKFPKGNQVGWFPAASLGWIVSNEGFLKSTPINNLKLKASYGVTGNNKVGFNVFTPSLARDYLYPIGGGTAQDGVYLDGATNPNLIWEEAVKQNYGFDVGIWNNRVTLTLDYFINSSKKLLIDDKVSPSAGIPSNTITRNVGDVEVKGIEVALGYNHSKGDFNWSVWGNVSTAVSKVNKLSDNLDQILLAQVSPPFSETLTRLAPGEPLYHFYGYIMDGVYSTNEEVIEHLGEGSYALNPEADAGIQFQAGDVRYRDISGPEGVPDGLITADDRTIIGDPNPDFTYSLNFNASYKGFDASILVTGVQGVDILNANTWYLQSQDFVANFSTDVLRRWQQPGDITDIPRFRFVGNNSNNFISTRYIEDGSYARVKNITVGYSLSKNLLDAAFDGVVSKVRFYLQSQNPLTLTKYSGFDPETEPFYGTGGTVVGIGIDRGRQPQPQTFLAGIQVEF
ncbi:MAG: TonB-dependent receptor [Cyclobacteriaceae bacterium]